MKKLRWNLGILMIRFGYYIRGKGWMPKKVSVRWYLGAFILGKAYKFRGKIPQKTWKWNHV